MSLFSDIFNNISNSLPSLPAFDPIGELGTSISNIQETIAASTKQPDPEPEKSKSKSGENMPTPQTAEDSFKQALKDAENNPDTGGTQTLPDGSTITVNQVYANVGEVKFVNSKSSWAAGSGYIATSRELTAEELQATAYLYNNWDRTTAGGGSGLTYNQAVQEVSALDKAPEIVYHSSSSVYKAPADSIPKTYTPDPDVITLSDAHIINGVKIASKIPKEVGFLRIFPLFAGLAGSKAVDTQNAAIDTAVTWRNDQYTKADTLITNGDTAEGAAAFASALLADCVLPLDLANVMSKTFQGRTSEITDDDRFAAGIDAVVLAIDIATMGVGAIPAGILKGAFKPGIKTGLRIIGLGAGATPAVMDLLDDDDNTSDISDQDPGSKTKKQTIYTEDPDTTSDTQTLPDTEDPDTTSDTPAQTGGGFWDTQTIGGIYSVGGAGVSTQADKITESYLIPAIIAGVALLILSIVYIAISKPSTKGGNHGIQS